MKRTTLRTRMAGMGMVELMVAMAIGLIGIIVIFQVFSVNEGVRRSTTAGSDEQTSGILGLMLLERELRHAGFGINDPDLIGCTVHMYDSQQSPSNVPAFQLSAVSIASNAGTTPDVLTVTYGGATRTTVPVALSTDMDDPTSQLNLIYFFGFEVGDVVLIGQPEQDCTLRQVTGLSKTDAYLLHAAGARFNKSTGTPTAYQALSGARVVNLGPSPVRSEITVRNDSTNPSQNNQLVVSNIWGSTASAVAMGEQIVQLKAEYGLDDGVDNGSVVREVYKADDNIVDKFTSNTPATAQDWARVRSVRLALVSRSSAPERPTAGTACDATPEYSSALDQDTYPVRWARGPDSPLGRPIDVRTSADWRCYKYKVYETVVPLRNMLWRQA